MPDLNSGAQLRSKLERIHADSLKEYMVFLDILDKARYQQIKDLEECLNEFIIPFMFKGRGIKIY